MPKSTVCYRALIGNYQNKLYDEKIGKNITSAPGVRSRHSAIQDDFHQFTWAANSHEKLNSPSNQACASNRGIAVPLILLLSQVRFENCVPAVNYYCHANSSEREIAPSTSRYTHIDISNNGFSDFWKPIANTLYETSQFIYQHDPLKFPGANALPVKENKSSDILKKIRHIRHHRQHPVPPLTKKASRNIQKVLQEKGLLKNGKVCKKELMLAVSGYLFSGENGITENKKEVGILAREILNAGGLYGGEKNENISTVQAESAVRHWFFSNILGMSPIEYIEDKIKVDAYKNYYTVSSVDYLLSFNQIITEGYLNVNNVTLQQWSKLNAMWTSFLTKEMPFLAFKDSLVESMELGSYDFAHLYSGSCFMDMFSNKVYTPDEAMMAGEKMWNLAVTEGVTEDKIFYFRLPATIFVLFSSPENIIRDKINSLDAINSYIQYLKDVKETQREIKIKYNNYVSATEQWLRKGELAEKIISQCPIIPHGLSNMADTIRTKAQLRKRGEEFEKQLYLRGASKPCKSAPESLDEEYRKITANVADNYRDIDKYIISSAIGYLSNDEREFISSPDAIIHLANYHLKMFASCEYNMFDCYKYYFTAEHKHSDIFVVKQGEQERVYALKAIKKNDELYKVIRVDHDLKNYILNGIMDDEYGITWDQVKDGKAIINAEVRRLEPAITLNGNNIKSLIDSLSTKHRNNLYKKLYEIGNDKSDIEKVWKVIKHLIPFYDCVEDSIKGKVVSATISCLLDAVEFIPVFGQAAKISGKFGIGLAKGISKGGIMVGRGQIKSAGKAVLKEIRIPTTHELGSLGKNTLRAIDPGFEILTYAGKGLRKKIDKLLSSDKKTEKIAKKITSIGELNSLAEIPSDKFLMALIPGGKMPVPVKVIGNQSGRLIYVRVNIETGEAYGKKYFIGNVDSPKSTVSKNIKEGHDNKHHYDIHGNIKNNRIIQDYYLREQKKLAGKIQRMDQHPLELMPLMPNMAHNINQFPRLDRFIEPLSYYRDLFGHQRVDLTEAIHAAVRGHYARGDVYLHRFVDSVNTIPERFQYLRENINNINIKINIARNDVANAKNVFRRTTLRNQHGELKYPERNAIISYLSGVLRTRDQAILHQAIERLYYYVNNIDDYFKNFSDRIVISTSSTIEHPYQYNVNCPLGFSMPFDSRNRIVIMADNFNLAPIPSTDLHLTTLHEISHRYDSVDFILSPSTRDVGDASEFINVVDDALNFRNNEFISNDDFFISAYGNHIGMDLNSQNIPIASFHQIISNDPMLKANIMMENADFIAIFISDIANGRNFNHDYLRPRRNKRGNDVILKKHQDISRLLLSIIIS